MTLQEIKDAEGGTPEVFSGVQSDTGTLYPIGAWGWCWELVEDDGIPAWIKALRPGDEVNWTDPDGGLCSRTGKIGTIEFPSDFVRIVWEDGAVTECDPEELS